MAPAGDRGIAPGCADRGVFRPSSRPSDGDSALVRVMHGQKVSTPAEDLAKAGPLTVKVHVAVARAARDGVDSAAAEMAALRGLPQYSVLFEVVMLPALTPRNSASPMSL